MSAEARNLRAEKHLASLACQPQVLIVDDDEALLELLSEFYKSKGFITHQALHAEAALDLAFEQSRKFDLVVSDLVLPERDGLDLLLELQTFSPSTPVILITANQSVETAVLALKQGAFDYITKPLNFQELEIISRRALQYASLEKDLAQLKEIVKPQDGILLGSSPKMRELKKLIEQVAPSSASILIQGESGSGKEVVAKELHFKSPRNTKPFVPVNCAAIPSALLEAELFGHRKGAFTGATENRLGLFEEAQGGTLFLDEIGDMPLSLQTKILRALQEKSVKRVGENQYHSIDVRIIAATNKDLKMAVRMGSFREDLYYRLNVIPLHVPPLRARREDIPLLAHFFLKKFNLLNGKNIQGFEKEALVKLKRLRWSGNVRELENTVERSVILTSSSLIRDTDISIEGNLELSESVGGLFSSLPSIKELEDQYISYVLEKTQGRKDDAAQILGINRKTLYRKEKGLSNK